MAHNIQDTKYFNKIDEILRKSGISIHMDSSLEDIKNGTYSYDEFISYIDDCINHTMHNYATHAEFRKEVNLLDLIIGMSEEGDEIKFEFVRDLPIFNGRSITKVESGQRSSDFYFGGSRNTNSLIITTDEGKLFRMIILEYSTFSKDKVVFEEIRKHLPESQTGKELFDKVNEIMQPLLEFDLGPNEFIRENITQYLPYNDHSCLNQYECAMIEYWEDSINCPEWRIPRDIVAEIIDILISNYTDSFLLGEIDEFSMEVAIAIGELQELE